MEKLDLTIHSTTGTLKEKPTINELSTYITKYESQSYVYRYRLIELIAILRINLRKLPHYVRLPIV